MLIFRIAEGYMVRERLGTPGLDLVVIAKNIEALIVEPCEPQLMEKKRKRTEKFQHLLSDIQRTWNSKVRSVPFVTGALGAIRNNLKKHLEIPGKSKIHQTTKTSVLCIPRILQKVLQIAQ